MKHLALAALLLSVGCSDDTSNAAPPVDGATVDARVDSGPIDAGPLDATRTADAQPDAEARPDAAPDAGHRFTARPRNPSTAQLPAPRGWRLARGLIHMHNVYSHDACDGRPLAEDGTPNWPCHARFRAAMCHNRHDFVLMTDHPDSVAERTILEALYFQDGDTLEPDAQAPVANRLHCEDGHEVLLTAGSEGDLMPTMFRQMPAPNFLRDRSPEGSDALKAAGALVFQAHMERFTAEEIVPLNLDGIEIYNIHANLDPRGEVLGTVLPDLAVILDAKTEGPHPDLWYSAIFRPGEAAMQVWDDTLPHRRMLGFAGSDTHENVPLPFDTGDGERIESYRRITGWFSNMLLVEGAPTYDSVRAALEAGRLYVVFDMLGVPRGFDFYGLHNGQIMEMGSEAFTDDPVRIEVVAPVIPEGDSVEMRLLRITEGSREVVATSQDAALSFLAREPGAYRVEVSLTAEHLRPEMGIVADQFIRPQLWIYSNPIYLRASHD